MAEVVERQRCVLWPPSAGLWAKAREQACCPAVCHASEVVLSSQKPHRKGEMLKGWLLQSRGGEVGRLPYLSRAVVCRPRLHCFVSSKSTFGSHRVHGSPLFVDVQFHLGECSRTGRLEERQAGCWVQKASVDSCRVPTRAALVELAGQRSGVRGMERLEQGHLLFPCREADFPEEEGDSH